MPAWMLKKPSGFSTECIIFASFILISGWWSPDYTVSFCCRSSWSLQKKREKKRRLKCGNRSAVIFWWQERCTSMQVYSYVTHNCSETIFKTGLKEITRTTQRGCHLTNLLGLHAGKAEGCRDHGCNSWGRSREVRGASPAQPAQLAPCLNPALNPPVCNVRCFPTAACNGLTPSEKFWLRKSFLDALWTHLIASYCSLLTL